MIKRRRIHINRVVPSKITSNLSFLNLRKQNRFITIPLLPFFSDIIKTKRDSFNTSDFGQKNSKGNRNIAKFGPDNDSKSPFKTFFLVLFVIKC